jgi:hypothetical protein
VVLAHHDDGSIAAVLSDSQLDAVGGSIAEFETALTKTSLAG